MKPLEDELRGALRRIDPPAGFAGRVMARVEQKNGVRPATGWLWPLRSWLRVWRGAWSTQRAVLGLAATAAALVLAFSFLAWRHYRIVEEQRQGELARAQVIQALHITSVKLNRVRTKVREATQDGTRGSRGDTTNRTSRSGERGRLAHFRGAAQVELTI